MVAVVETPTKRTAEPASRLAILRAAMEEFALRGYAGARTEGIAHVAGVNHALLFYHFKTKEQLYTAVVERVFSEWAKQVSRALDRKASPKRRLLAYVDAYFDFIAEFSLAPKLVQQEQLRQSKERTEHLRKLVKRYIRPVHRKLAILLRQGISSGEFQDLDVDHCIHSISALIVFYFTSDLAMESMESSELGPRSCIEARREAVLDFVSKALFMGPVGQ